MRDVTGGKIDREIESLEAYPVRCADGIRGGRACREGVEQIAGGGPRLAAEAFGQAMARGEDRDQRAVGARERLTLPASDPGPQAAETTEITGHDRRRLIWRESLQQVPDVVKGIGHACLLNAVRLRRYSHEMPARQGLGPCAQTRW